MEDETEVDREVARLRAASRAPATVKAYRSDLADFQAWAEATGAQALPATADLVARYLAIRGRTLKVATLERRLAAIVDANRRLGRPLDLADPLLREVRAGLRRTKGLAQAGKRPLLADDIRDLVAALPRDLAGVRDKAVILITYAGSLRASDTANLDVDDVFPTSDGVALRIRRGKADQEQRGSLRAIAFGAHAETCPVRALRAWLMHSGAEAGRPVFRPISARTGRLGDDRLSPGAISAIVKRAVGRAARAEGWSRAEIAARVAAVGAHSLRSGSLTQGALAHATELELMRHSSIKSVHTVRRYVRPVDPFLLNLSRRLGL